MEEIVISLGEKLKTARESKYLDFDQASKDTKIALRYLEALENEDFSGFPGEAYITGFLRNYGTYLDLDVQELLSLYRTLKMQEQPIPVEQLLKQPSSLPKVAIAAAAVILALGLIGGGIFFILSQPRIPRAVTPAPRAPVEYTMNGDNFEHRFFRGDTVLVPLGIETSTGEDAQVLDRLKLELLNLEEAVTIGTPGGSVILDLSQEAIINLDNGGTSNLHISAVDYAKNNADMGVLLRFEIKSIYNQTTVDSTSVAVVTNNAQSDSPVIFNSPNPYPFTLQAAFQGYCMFRWEILMERDRRDRNERYFQRSDELNIQAQNGIRIWASNAQAAKFQVIGGGRTVPIEIGSAGEVVVVELHWVRDEDNRYRLIVTRLENART
jgi:cytoskeletal protein RodZ